MAEKRRPPVVGRYMQEEVALATRNSGMPLEALRDFPLHNTGVNRFRHRLGAWELQSWGEVGHLDLALDDPE